MNSRLRRCWLLRQWFRLLRSLIRWADPSYRRHCHYYYNHDYLRSEAARYKVKTEDLEPRLTLANQTITSLQSRLSTLESILSEYRDTKSSSFLALQQLADWQALQLGRRTIFHTIPDTPIPQHSPAPIPKKPTAREAAEAITRQTLEQFHAEVVAKLQEKT